MTVVTAAEPLEIELPPLHSGGQRAIVASKARVVTVACGRRWGKTTVALGIALLYATRGLAVLWIAPTSRNTLPPFERLRAMLRALKLGDEYVHIRASRGEETVCLGPRGRIDFRSAESDAGLRGEGYAMIVADEAAHIPERVWVEVVRPMLLDTPGGRVLLTSTPRAVDDWFARTFRRGMRTADHEIEEGFESFTFPSWSNPHLAKKEIDDARADMSPTAFAREIAAEFRADDAVLFPSLTRGDPPACEDIACGVDLAISEKTRADWTCIVVAGRAADGTVWILAAERGHWSLPETLAHVASIAQTWGAKRVAVEQVAYQRAAVDALQRMPELGALAVEGVVPHGDKVARAQPLTPRVASGAVRFSNELPPWFCDQVKGFPLAEHDDAVDALGLAYGAANQPDTVDMWQRALKGWNGG